MKITIQENAGTGARILITNVRTVHYGARVVTVTTRGTAAERTVYVELYRDVGASLDAISEVVSGFVEVESLPVVSNYGPAVGHTFDTDHYDINPLTDLAYRHHVQACSEGLHHLISWREGEPLSHALGVTGIGRLGVHATVRWVGEPAENQGYPQYGPVRGGTVEAVLGQETSQITTVEELLAWLERVRVITERIIELGRAQRQLELAAIHNQIRAEFGVVLEHAEEVSP